MCGVIFAAMLALRLLAPAGFMPAFDRGTLTIVVCPDADPAPVSAMAAHHHHHGHSSGLHQQCPYASASGLGALVPDFAALVGALLIAAVLPRDPNLPFTTPSRDRERPPLRGPPLPA